MTRCNIQNLICTYVVLPIFSVGLASSLSLEQIESIAPSRSTLHILSDFSVENQQSWEGELFNFFLQSTKFRKILHPIVSISISSNRYSRSCEHNEYIVSKSFGHTTTHISIIFLHKTETDSDQVKLIEIRERLSYCGENPSYIFLVLSIPINRETFRVSPLSSSTSKLFVLQSRWNRTERIQIYVVCLPCRLHSLAELNPSRGDHQNFFDTSWKKQNSELQGLQIDSQVNLTFQQGKDTCSAIKLGPKTFSGKFACAQLALWDKLN